MTNFSLDTQCEVVEELVSFQCLSDENTHAVAMNKS